MARNVNRTFIGTDLCFDLAFVNNVTKYAMVFVPQGLALRSLPKPLHTFLLPAFNLPIRVVFRKPFKTGPEIERRKAAVDCGAGKTRGTVDPKSEIRVT